MYIPTYMVVFLWVMALFGIISLIVRIIMGIKWQKGAQRGKYSIIISAKNQEDTIEGFVRGFILEAEMDGQGESLFNVILVDAKSTDDTPQVMQRLAKEYCFVRFVSCGELPSYLKEQWCKW